MKIYLIMGEYEGHCWVEHFCFVHEEDAINYCNNQNQVAPKDENISVNFFVKCIDLIGDL